MIKNEKQYRISKNKLKKFEEALELVKNSTQTKTHPILVKAQIDSINSQVEELKEEVKKYEELKAGIKTNIPVKINCLSNAIIESRIARGFSHKKLGELLGVKEQQIQKYEAENYMSASWKRLLDIIEVLDVDVNAIFNLKRNFQRKKPSFILPDHLDVRSIERKIYKRGVTVEMCK